MSLLDFSEVTISMNNLSSAHNHQNDYLNHDFGDDFLHLEEPTEIAPALGEKASGEAIFHGHKLEVLTPQHSEKQLNNTLFDFQHDLFQGDENSEEGADLFEEHSIENLLHEEIISLDGESEVEAGSPEGEHHEESPYRPDHNSKLTHYSSGVPDSAVDQHELSGFISPLTVDSDSFPPEGGATAGVNQLTTSASSSTLNSSKREFDGLEPLSLKKQKFSSGSSVYDMREEIEEQVRRDFAQAKNEGHAKSLAHKIAVTNAVQRVVETLTSHDQKERVQEMKLAAYYSFRALGFSSKDADRLKNGIVKSVLDTISKN